MNPILADRLHFAFFSGARLFEGTGQLVTPEPKYSTCYDLPDPFFAGVGRKWPVPIFTQHPIKFLSWTSLD
jgi:hypothetical protein